MNRTTSIVVVAVLALLSACAPFFTSKAHVAEVADEQTKPIILALEIFRKRTGHYPSSLKELEQPPEGSGVYISNGTRPVNKGWVDYWTTSPTSYVLVFSTAFSHVGYKNGERGNVYVNPFR